MSVLEYISETIATLLKIIENYRGFPLLELVEYLTIGGYRAQKDKSNVNLIVACENGIKDLMNMSKDMYSFADELIERCNQIIELICLENNSSMDEMEVILNKMVHFIERIYYVASKYNSTFAGLRMPLFMLKANDQSLPKFCTKKKDKDKMDAKAIDFLQEILDQEKENNNVLKKIYELKPLDLTNMERHAMSTKVTDDSCSNTVSKLEELVNTIEERKKYIDWKIINDKVTSEVEKRIVHQNLMNCVSEKISNVGRSCGIFLKKKW